MPRMRVSTFFRILVTTSLLSAGAAAAQSVDRQVRDWTVFKNGALCYIGSKPVSEAKNGAYLLVTHRGPNLDEVSADFGTATRPGAPVTIVTGQGNLPLFSQNDMAWAKDAATDRRIVEAFKKSGGLRLKATDADGTAIEQKYSLSGFATAYARMSQLCK